MKDVCHGIVVAGPGIGHNETDYSCSRCGRRWPLTPVDGPGQAYKPKDPWPHAPAPVADGSQFHAVGWQWHCTLQDGTECDGSGGGFEDDQPKIFRAAKHHKAMNPSHLVVIERMSRRELPRY